MSEGKLRPFCALSSFKSITLVFKEKKRAQMSVSVITYLFAYPTQTNNSNNVDVYMQTERILRTLAARPMSLNPISAHLDSLSASIALYPTAARIYITSDTVTL